MADYAGKRGGVYSEEEDDSVTTEEETDMNFLPALISALIIVESGSIDQKTAGPAALALPVIGDHGKALGILQIHKEVIADVNRIYKSAFKHSDALNPMLSREICAMYLKHYAPINATPEQCARIWNGGPRGHLKASTEKYWQKVKRELQSGKGTEAQSQSFGIRNKTAGPAALALP